MARREVIELLKKYILLLKSEGISVSKAFLFGSYAFNNYSNTSDIDVMIVSDNFDENDDVVIGKVWSLTKKINTRIEPFFIGIKKFKSDDSSPLISKVKTEGIELLILNG